MGYEPTIMAGFIGLAIGTGVHFWSKKQMLEERCEFLAEMGQDIEEAFKSADDVLRNSNIPKPIRMAILILLAAHRKPEYGKKMALGFMREQIKGPDDRSQYDDPISQSMSSLGKNDPVLARKAHHVLASLIFGLVFLNLADNIRVEKVKDQAAKDPATLWVRISKLFGANNDNEPHQGSGFIRV